MTAVMFIGCNMTHLIRHGVFGQFSGQQQTHGGLHLSRCDGGALVVVRETRRDETMCSKMSLMKDFMTLSYWDFTSSMIFLLLGF